MSLTQGSGPLGRGGGAANYTFDAPAHRILFQPYGPRLRAVIEGRTIFDTTGAYLLYETGIKPVAYVPLEDFDAALMTPTNTSTHCPFKGDASYWSLHVGGRELTDAVWAYPWPVESALWLDGFAALDRRHADHFLVEGEPVAALRDPYHRCDVHAGARPAEIRAEGVVLARSERPQLLFETSLPVRAYLPREDVPDGLLEPSGLTTHCPYKGDAENFHVRLPSGSVVENGAWVYAAPVPEVGAIAGLIGFGGEGLDVAIG